MLRVANVMNLKVLHILDHSLPKTDGYAVRSSNIVRYQRQHGVHPIVLTSPAHPNCGSEFEVIDGIRHYRTCANGLSSTPFLHQLTAIRRMSKRINEIVSIEQPDILHAHSPSLWGLATVRSAHQWRKPFVYEVRGFWEDAAVDQGKTNSTSLRYRLSQAAELRVVRAANAVITIAQELKRDLVLRGIEADKISVVNNGVDRQSFCPQKPDVFLENKLGLNGYSRIGYVGTLYPWEGVEDLVRAVPLIRKSVPEVRVLIVGGGQLYETLRETIDATGVSDFVNLIGSVPHTEISKYYSVMDVLVYPRKSSRNTETVTPLKPLEAMAMEKAVIGSDVGGIRELVIPGAGALFVSGSPESLAEKCVDLLLDPEKRQAFVANALQKVVAPRDWKLVAESYIPIYSKVLGC